MVRRSSYDGKEKKIILCENISVSTSDAFYYTDKKLDINFNISNSKFSTVLNVKMWNKQKKG